MYSSSTYFLICKMAKLTLDEMSQMTLGMCLDHVSEYYEMMNPSEKENVREASQSDYDRF